MKNPIGVQSGPMLDPWGTLEKFKAMGLSAVDPFGIPSAGLGLLSPSMRDHWRAGYEDNPQGRLLGSVLGGYGAMKMLPQATTLPRGLLAGAATGGGSDVVDAAIGNGGVDKNTALNAAIGAALYPVGGRLPKGAR